MDIKYNLISVIDILGVAQGVLFGTMLLWLHTKNNRPTLYLGLFILLFSLEPIPNILNDLGLLRQYPMLELLPVHFYFLAYPLFYIYIQKISVFNTGKPSYWTLVPGFVEIIGGLVIFFLPLATKLDIRDSGYVLIYFIIGLGYSIFIGALIIRLILKHQMEVENQFSQLLNKRLIWAKQFVSVSICFQLFLLVDFFIANLYWYYFVTVVNVILIYWVSFKGITQESVVSLLLTSDNWNDLSPVKKETVSVATNDINGEPNAKSKFMTADNIKEVVEAIEDYVVSSQCFIKDNLTIVDIAEAINIHPKRISYSLNNHLGVNFNNYINKFRVEKAKELFNDVSTNNLSVEGIGIESGFHSKATFYASFRKFEGCTPASYRNT